MPESEQQLGGPHNHAATTSPLGSASPLLPASPLPLPHLCARVHGRIVAFLASDSHADERVKRVQDQTRTSLAVIEEALDRYGLPELSISYNGGKDCLVLLILYLSALHSKNALQPPSPTSQPHPPIRSVYIVSPHPFDEVDDFVTSSSKAYSLSLTRYAKPMKTAFEEYLHENPSVKAIFVGTRRTDPHGEFLTHFDRTDHGWPDFMRIHPVIDWHYVEIWTFIRHLNIPYCALYDQGYTSLGGTTDTHPNPALRRNPTSTDGRSDLFRPAYELVEDLEERLGRDRERSKRRPPGGEPVERAEEGPRK